MIKFCKKCNEKKKIVAKGLCWKCYNAQRIEKCVHCGEKKRIAARTKDGGAMCQSCHTEECVHCGEKKRIAARTEDGGAMCQSCHTEECVYCGEKKRIQARTKDGGAMCQSCQLIATGRHGICPSCNKGPRSLPYISPLTKDKICGGCHRRQKKEVQLQPTHVV